MNKPISFVLAKLLHNKLTIKSKEYFTDGTYSKIITKERALSILNK